MNHVEHTYIGGSEQLSEVEVGKAELPTEGLVVSALLFRERCHLGIIIIEP